PRLFLILLPPIPNSALFPYTTLFRSRNGPSHQRRRWHRASLRSISMTPWARTERLWLRVCGSDDLDRVHELGEPGDPGVSFRRADRKSTRLNSSHQIISYAVFCLKKK